MFAFKVFKNFQIFKVTAWNEQDWKVMNYEHLTDTENKMRVLPKNVQWGENRLSAGCEVLLTVQSMMQFGSSVQHILREASSR